MEKIKIEMTIEEWDIVYKLLQDVPYRMSKNIISKIESEVNKQKRTEHLAKGTNNSKNSKLSDN